MGELMPGWKQVKFGEVVRQVKDKVDPEKSGLERFVAGEHMDTDDRRIRRWGEIGDGYLGPAFHMRFRVGHVLYGSRRTYLRKVAVADFEGICSNTTFILESANPATLLPELLPFIMQTEAFHEHSIRESKGSVNPYVNFSDLAWYEFALPPLEEQTRLLRVLSHVETTIDSIKVAIEVATKQTSSIRDRTTFHGESSVTKLPAGWSVKLIGDVVDFVGGAQPPASVFESSPSETNVRLIQIRDYKSNDFVTYIPRSMARRECKADDVMIGRYGPPVFQILRGLEGTYNVALIKAVPKDELLKNYLFHYLKGQRLQSLIDGLSRRSCGQAGVDMEKLRLFPIPLPPTDVQKSLSSAFDSMERSIEMFHGRLKELYALRRRVAATLC